MAKLDVYNMEGAVVGEIELSDTIFGLEEPTKQLCTKLSKLFWLINARVQRNAYRSERRGGGRKPYRQKVQVVLAKVRFAPAVGRRRCGIWSSSAQLSPKC